VGIALGAAILADPAAPCVQPAFIGLFVVLLACWCLAWNQPRQSG
jgi:hypothetical protein